MKIFGMLMTSSTAYDSTSHTDRLDLQQVRRFIMRRWPVMLGGAVLFAGLALAVCVVVAPVYLATAQVLLDPPKKQALDKEALGGNDALDSSVVDSQVPLILSNRTLSRVAADEHLDTDPDFSRPNKPGILRRLMNMLRPSPVVDDTPAPVGEIDPRWTPVIGRLLNTIDVARVAKSNVISITVASRNPRKAMRLANAMAQTYVDNQVEVHVKATQEMAIRFEARLSMLRAQVRDSENAVALFRKSHGIATTTDEKVTVSDQELTSLNEKLTAASSETADKLAKYNQAKLFAQGMGDPFTLLEVVRSPVVGQLRAQQAELMRREASMKEIYGPLYPALRQIHAQRSAIDAAIASEKSRVVSTLKNDYEVALAHEKSIRETMANLSNPTPASGDVGVRLRELERTNQANKLLFESFLSQSKLTQEQPTFELPDARVISPALEPTQPSSPKTSLIVPVASLVGLILGVGVSIGLENFGGGGSVVPKAKTSWTQTLQNVPIIGQVTAIIASEQRAHEAAFEDLDDQDVAKSAFCLSVGSLAAKLERAIHRAGPILSCAPLLPETGCSTLVYWLARTIGTSGKRVLLIDAGGDDPDRSLSSKLRLWSRTGLGEVLQGTVPFGAAVLPRKAFAFMPVGRANADLGRPATVRQFTDMLEKARAHYDVIIIDCPPLVGSRHLGAWRNMSDLFIAIANPDRMAGDALNGVTAGPAADPGLDGLVFNSLSQAKNEPRIIRAI